MDSRLQKILERLQESAALALPEKELFINAIEGQERELALEASLERVRTVAMGMKTADDLLKICESIFNEFRLLGFAELRNAMINIHDDEKRQLVDYDYSDAEGKTITAFAYDLHPIITRQVKETRAADDAFIEFALSGKELSEFRELRIRNGERDDHRLDKIASLNYYFYSIGNGSIGISTFGPVNADKQLMLKRFRNVFSLSYQRYIDIANAEAQAREARIEASLERVRGKAMAMHSSDDISATTNVVFGELKKLGIESMRCGVVLPSKTSRIAEVYAAATSSDGELTTLRRLIEMTDHPCQVRQYDSWLNQQTYIAELKGEELKSYYRLPFFYSSPTYVPPERYDETEFGYYYPFPEGLFYAWTKKKYSESEAGVLSRFRSIIALTFRRFLDLQKAEAQARESQIEAALERVRARTMAMQRSDELKGAAALLFQQIKSLGVPAYSCGYNIWEPDDSVFTSWMSRQDGSDFNAALNVRLTEDANFKRFAESRRTGEQFFVLELRGERMQEHYRYLKTIPEFKAWFEYAAAMGFPLPETQYHHVANFSHGNILVISLEPCPQFHEVFKRFATVFDQTYTRFLDFQKAEAQAREAQIEAALERVRSKAMAMHKTDDLASAVSAVFEELDKLDLEMLRCGIGVLNRETRNADVWTTTMTDLGKTIQVSGDEPMDIHPLLQGAYEGWLRQEDFSYILEGDDLNAYYRALTEGNFKLPESEELARSAGIRQYYYCTPWLSGGLFAFRDAPFTVEAKAVMKRFADVFTLTYTRFLDLQKAEAQAREAQIEAGLERVRSRTLAMQSSDELAETAAVLFRQLIMLGVEPNRLYIAIIKDEFGNSKFWITDEDGTKVNLGFLANLIENSTFNKMFEGWKEQRKSLVIDMHGKELQEYFTYLTALHVPFKGGLSQQRRVQTIAYFSQGFIGIASPTPETDETLNLLERFAGVFNLTYTRFNDLKIAEAHAVQAEQDLINLKTEKKRAEEALTELRATQEQLIQQEKLASLGQLTAGIAHEIKNPLNFVNNFSDVSIELVAEAVDELKKPNGDSKPGEVLAILDDVYQNLKKINEHGKRADGIVKSMLQHSRGSGGKLDPADMNAVIKEYVNLAFHGMRAGKNPINVDIQLELDASLKAVPLITEDFSRVVVNVCQNAFDAMREKMNVSAKGYSPRLTVRTSRVDSKVQVEIEDNGPGIPEEIKNKILQPFFTTKKGTQGTGLGLSITNDIIKAHRGELRIDSNGNEGAKFIIVIPA